MLWLASSRFSIFFRVMFIRLPPCRINPFHILFLTTDLPFFFSYGILCSTFPYLLSFCSYRRVSSRSFYRRARLRFFTIPRVLLRVSMQHNDCVTSHTCFCHCPFSILQLMYVGFRDERDASTYIVSLVSLHSFPLAISSLVT